MNTFLETPTTVVGFSTQDVKITYQPYWNQFRNPAWVLYKAMAYALTKAIGTTVEYFPGEQHAVRVGDLSISILEDQCFVFENCKPVLQVAMRLPFMWAHLLPAMLRL